jgi:hypothetical protein
MKAFSLFLFLSSSISVYFAQPSIPQKNNSGTWYFLDLNFKKVLIVTKIKIDSAGFFNEGFAPARDSKTKLWGFLNETGTWQIKPQFNEVNNFKDGYAVVFKKCKICCKNQEGLLTDFIGYVIDKKGITKFTDASQEETIDARMFLQENLGLGLFTFQRAWSLGEKHSFMNLKGEVLGDDVMYYGLGGIYYDEEMKAVQCGSIYYDISGKEKLNLSQFRYLSKFKNGYVWGSVEIPVSEDSITNLKVLIDSVGTAVMNFDVSYFHGETDVNNGMVTFISAETETRNKYVIATGEFELYDGPEIEIESNYEYTFGNILKNGIRPVYSSSAESQVVGVKFLDGTIKLFSEIEIEE